VGTRDFALDSVDAAARLSPSQSRRSAPARGSCPQGKLGASLTCYGTRLTAAHTGDAGTSGTDSSSWIVIGVPSPPRDRLR
jgi:hypothetical protein